MRLRVDHQAVLWRYVAILAAASYTSVANFAVLPLYSRVLSNAEFGFLSLALQLSNIVAVFCSVALPSIVMRNGASSPEELKTLLFSVSQIVLCAGLAAVIPAVLVIEHVVPAKELGREAILMFIASLLLNAFAQALAVYHRLLHQHLKIVLVSAAYVVSFTAFQYSFIGFANRFLTFIAATYLVTTALTLFVYAHSLFDRKCVLGIRRSVRQYRGQLRFGFFTMLSAVAVLGTASLYRIGMLNKLSADFLGLYAYAFAITLGFEMLIFAPVAQMWAHSRLMSGTPEAFQATARRYANVFVTGFAIAFAALYALKPLLSGMMGEDRFAKIGLLLPFLLYSSFVKAISVLFDDGIFMTQRTEFFLTASLLSGIVAVGLIFQLPAFSADDFLYIGLTEVAAAVVYFTVVGVSSALLGGRLVLHLPSILAIVLSPVIFLLLR